MQSILANSSSFWMPTQQSSYAAAVDWTFYFIYYVSVFFTLLIAALVVYFAVRYHERGNRGQKGQGPSHSTALEMTWTVIPVIIVILIFISGFRGFMDMATPPANAIDIMVSSKKWAWTFKYPNGAESDVLYVPAERPVMVTLESQDVIHSFYIPDFRTKKDAVPGRYNKAWFEAKWDPTAAQTFTPETGQPVLGTIHDLFCAEYCGTNHSWMRAKVVVLPYDQYVAKVTELGNILGTMSPAAAGKQLLQIKGCNQCHTVDGSPLIGPTFKDLYNHEVILSTGDKTTADDNYIRESILNPGAKIVAGYDNVMPSFAGRIKDDEVNAIVWYLKSISEHYEGVIPEAPLAGDGAPAAE